MATSGSQVGQLTRAGSLSVVLASDQTSVPVGSPAPATVYNPGAQSPTASGNSGTLSTTAVASLAVDINLTAITGGTAATIIFAIDRLGLDGIWYQVFITSALTAAGSVTTSIGPGATVGAVLTSSCRLRWVFGGTVVATSITFTASIVGR